MSLTSTANLTDWKEVTTDAEGEELNRAYDTVRNLTDQASFSGSYSESYSGYGYSSSTSSSYSGGMSSRVDEVKVGDSDYEYFYKDQESAMSVSAGLGSSSGSGGSGTLQAIGSMTQSSRTHKTLEYEITGKDTASPVYREFTEQTRSESRGSSTYGGSYDNTNTVGRSQVNVDPNDGSYDTSPQGSPQSVGGGWNPSSGGNQRGQDSNRQMSPAPLSLPERRIPTRAHRRFHRAKHTCVIAGPGIWGFPREDATPC